MCVGGAQIREGDDTKYDIYTGRHAAVDHTQPHILLHTHSHTYSHTHSHTVSDAQSHTVIRTCTHTHAPLHGCKHICMHTDTHTHTRMLPLTCRQEVGQFLRRLVHHPAKGAGLHVDEAKDLEVGRPVPWTHGPQPTSDARKKT